MDCRTNGPLEYRAVPIYHIETLLKIPNDLYNPLYYYWYKWICMNKDTVIGYKYILTLSKHNLQNHLFRLVCIGCLTSAITALLTQSWWNHRPHPSQSIWKYVGHKNIIVITIVILSQGITFKFPDLKIHSLINFTPTTIVKYTYSDILTWWFPALLIFP